MQAVGPFDVVNQVHIDGPAHRRIIVRGRAPSPPPGGGTGDPTFADRDVTINPGDNWQSIINSQPAGTALNPIIFGVASGTHVRANTLGAFPKNYHWFVGQSDGVPTSRFPDGTPISIVSGTRTTAPGTDLFFGTDTATGATGVKVVMLEIDGFSPRSVRYLMGGPSCNDWYLSHINQHHSSEGGLRVGWGMHIRYSWFHHNGRDGHTAHNQQPSNEWLQNVIIEDTEVSFNNQLGYAPNVSGSHAGGTKYIATRGMIIRRCIYSNNGGPGIWFDSFSTGMQILDNIVWDNVLGSRAGEGIFIEICDCTTGALVQGNDVRRNGGASNIYISNSRGTALNPIVVRENLSHEHPQWEIIGSNVNRAPFAELGYTHIIENEMRRTLPSAAPSQKLSGIYADGTATPGQSVPGMVFDNNDYYWDTQGVGHGLPWIRNFSGYSFAGWQALGYDASSTFTEV